MKKLTLGLVFLFVCGMVGEAGAAPSFTEDYSLLANKYKLLNSDTATTRIQFDLTKTGTTSVINGNIVTPVTDGTGYLSTDIIDKAILGLTFVSNANAGTGSLIINFVDGSDTFNLYTGNLYSSGTTPYAYSNDLTTLSNLSSNDLAVLKNDLNDGKFNIDIKITGMTKKNGSPFLSISDANVNVTAHTAPLPGAAWLLGAGLIGLIGVRRKVLS